MTARGDLVGRLPGCVWDARLFNEAAVTGQGGTINGTVTVDQGLRMPGDNASYVTYDQSDYWYSDEITIGMEFYPDFALGVSGEERRVFVGKLSGSAEYYVYSSSSDDRLRIYMGGTYLGGDLGCNDYWQRYGRNQVIIAGTSGSTDLYLNGHLIGTRTGAWNPSQCDTLHLGGDGAFNFDGKVTQFFVVNRKWTAQEVKDWWNNKTFNYRERAIVYLPLRDQDKVGSTVLDRSGNGNNVGLGGGIYAPTKYTDMRGYSFDGGDVAIFNDESVGDYTDNFTLSLLVKWDVLGSIAGAVTKTADGETTGFIIFKGSDDKPAFASGGGTPADADSAVHQSQWVHVTIAVSGGTAYMWIDGALQGTSGTANITLNTADAIVMGAYYVDSASNQLTGGIAHFAIYPEVLTPTQIALEHRRLMETLHSV